MGACTLNVRVGNIYAPVSERVMAVIRVLAGTRRRCKCPEALHTPRFFLAPMLTKMAVETERGALWLALSMLFSQAAGSKSSKKTLLIYYKQ